MSHIASWGVLILIGVIGFVIALGFGQGESTGIGSGSMPLLLSGLLVAIALVGLFTSPDTSVAALELRPFLAVAGGIVLFVVAVERLGLIPTAMLTMMVSYLGQQQRAYVEFFLFATLFAGAVWLLFTLGLGLPVPAWGGH